ncbi:hypothetical protein GCM10010176_032340 [Nonomuraea spiralis]|nr:hypothetical protein GCM10010176_032340 [Nonomuraea spiralis]
MPYMGFSAVSGSARAVARTSSSVTMRRCSHGDGGPEKGASRLVTRRFPGLAGGPAAGASPLARRTGRMTGTYPETAFATFV